MDRNSAIGCDDLFNKNHFYLSIYLSKVRVVITGFRLGFGEAVRVKIPVVKCYRFRARN